MEVWEGLALGGRERVSPNDDVFCVCKSELCRRSSTESEGWEGGSAQDLPREKERGKERDKDTG